MVSLRKFLILFFLAGAVLWLAGCGGESAVPEKNGKLIVRSGLPPVAFIASRIGGDRVDSRPMLPEGRSPHDYSPRPHDVLALAKAKLFFVTRLNFEKHLVKALGKTPVRVVDVTAPGVEWIPFDGADHVCEEHGHEGHDHGAVDLHVWLSMKNASAIAENICCALCGADPAGRAYYEKNLAVLKQEFAQVQEYAKKELAPFKGRTFFVYHPAFGYFGNMTGLRQSAVELDGREATPAHLFQIIEKARKENVKVIFVQPQFNPGSARSLSEAIGGDVAGLDPLAADVVANTRKMTDLLKHGFSAERSPEK